MMRQRVSVHGREGIVKYLDDAGAVVSRGQATIAKVFFDDGGVSAYRLVLLEEKGGAGSGNFGHEGRPGQVGGSAAGTGGGGGASAMPPFQVPGGWNHSGVTWKQETDPDTGRPIPIKVATVEEAIPLVLDGKVVEVPDARAAYVLIDKLAKMATDAKAKGEKAPDYDLCNVSVSGGNLFCAQIVTDPAHPKGYSRIEMPQFGGEPVPGSEADKLPRLPFDKSIVDGSQEFISYLKGLGMKTQTETVPAAQLKASQRELIGQKVAGIMKQTKFDPADAPVFVSSDSYVVDGHHRWAAVVGKDAEDGTLGDSKMKIIRINAPITEVLHLGTEWAMRFGIKQSEGVKKQAAGTGLHTPPPKKS